MTTSSRNATKRDLTFSVDAPLQLKKQGAFAVLGARSTPAKRARLEAVLRGLPPLTPEARCLDIGTAHGGFASLFAHTGQWTFLDIDAENLEVARTILSGTFECADAIDYLQRTSTPLDLISCVGTIMYFDEPRALLDAIASRLKPGGHLLLTAREFPRHEPLLPWRRQLGIEAAIGARHRIERSAMAAALNELGFEIRRTLLYQGFFSMALQTLVDYLSLQPGQAGNRLTYHLQDLSEQDLNRKTWVCRISRWASTLTLFLDRCTWFLPRYGFVLLAEKKGGPDAAVK